LLASSHLYRTAFTLPLAWNSKTFDIIFMNIVNSVYHCLLFVFCSVPYTPMINKDLAEKDEDRATIVSANAVLLRPLSTILRLLSLPGS
ncbi:Hypothetical predicted protein, partial [Scomber scombrus]